MKKNFNYKLLFCVVLFLIALAFLFAIVVFNPQKINKIVLYDSSNEGVIGHSNGNIIHNIYPRVNNIVGLSVYLDDDSIIGCDFKINFYDENGNNYFSSLAHNYQSNILDLKLKKIKESSHKKFKLEINLINCDSINYKTMPIVNNGTHISNNSTKTMKISVSYLTKNDSYYWYIMMIIAFAFALLPLSRSKK